MKQKKNYKTFKEYIYYYRILKHKIRKFMIIMKINIIPSL